MIASKDAAEIRKQVFDFERRIEDMHLEFQKYHSGQEKIMPDWERIERELLHFSRRKIYDIGLSKQLDRIMYKFQNRKTIWLRWTEEVHHSSRK